MATKRFSLDTAFTLIAAYLRLFVGLIGANAINLALPAIRDSLGGGQEPTRGHWSDSTLDRHLLKFTQLSYPLDKPRRRLAEHHPTGRCDGFHSLRHPYLLADRRVTAWTGTHFASDHLARVQPYPQPQHDTVAPSYHRAESLRLLLDVKRSHAGTKCMVLQGSRRTKHCHQSIAGELVDGAAILLHHHG
jgi:hypothetical protein